MLTAMATPFGPDGSLDLDGVQRVAKHLIANGHDGLVVSGTTGESPTTTKEEDGEVLAAVRAAVGPDIKLVAGVGTNDTATSTYLARQAREGGADGVLLVSPYYNKPGQRGILHHFRQVVDVAELPVMLYDVPGRTGSQIALESFEEMASWESVVAVKDAVGDMPRAAKLAQLGYAVYSGDDINTLGFLAHGACGLVSVVGHAAGSDLASMIDAFLDRRPRRCPDDLPAAAAGVRGRDGSAQLRRDHGQGVAGAVGRARQPTRPVPAGPSRRRRGRGAPHRPRRSRSLVSHPHPELSEPAALAKGGLRVTAFGGLGEVGRNMTAFEYDGRLLIVDCGVLFPEDHQPGIDLILPDWSSIRDRLDTVEALVLTHGHEDHIGATPYLLRERGDIPLVGSKLTLALLGSKLREHRLKETVHHVVKEGDRMTFGPFELEFVAVNHSIPDALAVAIRTGAGMVLHTGDFKMDQLPLDGRITDLRAFGRLGEEGVDLFLTDSTNAETPGFTPSEKTITPVIDQVFRDSQQRIIVACFASHVHRVQQVLDAAVANKRKVAYVGRSMVRNMAIARDLGYLTVPPNVLVDAKELADLAPERQVLISTGSQGEPMSALSRIAQRNHNFVHIEEGDTVLLASSLIPGNENAVYRVINGLARWGAKVVHKGNAHVHVSGHASAGELLYCYNIVKPRNVLPVHGEIRHLLANAALARATGVENVVIAEDGVVVDLIDGVASVVGKVDCGYVFVDGASVGDITESDLKDRLILGEEGFISVIVVVDSVSGKVSGGPEIHAKGNALDGSNFEELRQPIIDALDRAIAEGNTDSYQLQQTVRRVVGRWVSNTHRRRPMIIPVVIEA